VNMAITAGRCGTGVPCALIVRFILQSSECIVFGLPSL
jgi:hypothetical protein